MTTDTFSSRVRSAREAAGLSQSAVAESLGVSPQAVCNYEKRNEGISIDKLFPLADVLGVSARWLLLGVDDGKTIAKSSPEVVQAIACLEAYIATGERSADLVKAALSLLKGGGR